MSKASTSKSRTATSSSNDRFRKYRQKKSLKIVEASTTTKAKGDKKTE
jgi:hypothetical protein